jgi:N-acyl-L-homoserine lactone synthetase
MAVEIFEQDFRANNLNSMDKIKSYQLRHKIFVKELGWVAPQKDQLEIDAYDGEGMMPLGVFDQTGRLIAHLRITLPEQTFMMEKEFAALIELPIPKTRNTVEVSRVCIEADVRNVIIINPYGKYHISMFLYKCLYLWCCKNLIKNMVMVIENKLFRLLKMSGFPCRRIGRTTIMPDGVSAVAVRVDWQEFESENQTSNPDLLAWFKDVNLINKAA